ncbi:MAG: hypothetical protein JNL35_03525 [Sphingopyxis sp.]|nr:hypothetical protein [Sphingopyxis sp.]
MASAIRAPGCAAALALAMAAPLHAQEEDAVPAADAMVALAAQVPPQSWYPEGYYDVRVAAEAQVAEAPRSKAAFVGSCSGGDGLCYDPFDPLPQRINPGESDPAVRRYGNIALDISRLRQELALTGYAAAAYAAALADYERKLVEVPAGDRAAATDAQITAGRAFAASVEASRKRQAPNLPRILDYDESAAMAQMVVVRSSGPSALAYPAGRKMSRDAKLLLRTGDQVELLDTGQIRTLRGPGTVRAGDTASAMVAMASPSGMARVGAVRGGSGGGRPAGIVFETSPPSGEVLLVSAFAFRICQRKIPDPWNRFACQWNEMETGVAKPLSGRFVYQVKWPDGTVRKGTREIAPAESGQVTFKKVGS